MIEKLDITFEKLIESKRIKYKWSEIESHGISELIHILWRDSVDSENMGHSIAIENQIVCLNLYEGITFEYNNTVYRFIRVYIDIDDNVIFLSVSKDVFIYETSFIDGTDLKHFVGSE